LTRSRLAEIAALLVVVLAAALLYGRALHDATSYDEGVYLASVDALRHGQKLGTDVFASQPPGFYLLLRAGAVPAGRSIQFFRAEMLMLALAGVVAAYAVGRALAGRAGGIVAAAILATAPAYATESIRIAADVASMVLALVALAFAAYARQRSLWLAALAGAACAAALSVKLLALPVLVPLALLLRRGRPLAAAALGAAVVAGGIAIVFASSLGSIWSDAVSFHRSARTLSGGANVHHVVDFFNLKTPFTWLVAAAALAALLTRRQAALWSFVVAALAFLLVHRPLLDHHFVLLAAAGAVAAGSSLPVRRHRVVAGVVAIAVAAAWIQQWRQIGRNDDPEPAAVGAAARELRSTTTRDELVGADLPIVPFRADRRLPGELVDTSAVRFESGSLTDRDVIAALEHAHVRAVVVGREFLSRPRLLRRLRASYRVIRVR
jgi:4-amino-4-deoxy-L-arabinose transferase-like glycosyltransferase